MLRSRAHALSHLTKPTLSFSVIIELNLQNAHALKVHCLKISVFKWMLCYGIPGLENTSLQPSLWPLFT